MHSTRVSLKNISFRAKNAKKLVPEQFLNLLETTELTSKRKIKHKKREEKVCGVLKKEYLYGISPCLAALEANRRKIYTIYYNDDAFNVKPRPEFEKIKTVTTTRSIQTKVVSKRRLDELSGNRPHQNIVMKVDSLLSIPLEKLDKVNQSDIKTRINIDEKRLTVWLVLDSIQDPMNMGAILRTAGFFAIDKVIINEYNNCGLTPAVSKASAGVMEILPVYTANIKQLLKKKRECCEILGTVGPYFVPQRNSCPVLTINNLKLKKPTLVVLGNEGKGLSTEIQNLCTKFLTIPREENCKVVDLDSLNVSVATGIILHSLLSNRETN